VISDDLMNMVSKDPKIISSDDQKRRDFCKMDVQEGSCVKIDYGGVHRVVIAE
jgi:hypothetical protein